MARRAFDRGGVNKRVHLLAITAELHVFEGMVHWDQPLRLGISISGQPFIRMWQQRGDSAGFDQHPLETEDFGEVGRVDVYDITDRLDPTLRNEEVGAVHIIQAGDAGPIGLALPRPGRKAFCLWINEDAFRCGDEAALGEESFPQGRKAAIGPALSQRRGAA